MKRLLLLVCLLLSLFVANIAAAQDGTTCEEGFKSLVHVLGEVCIPENVERVVALEWTYVEDLLAVGIQPVGVADIEGYHEWLKIPPTLDEGVTDVGTRQEPNLEVIAGLEPDLIIGVYFRLGENYDELNAIAPTLVFNPYPEDLNISQYDEMLTTFTTLAYAVNREAEAAEVLADMEAHFAAAQAALEEAGRGGESFILSQGWTTDSIATFRLFTDNAMAVQILEQIGLSNAWDDAPQLYGFTEIGIEGFAELSDQDFNFFYVAQGSDNDLFGESPLWSSLGFVAAERDYWLGGDAWLFGGPLSAQVVVDGVLTAMGIEVPTAQAVAETCEPGFRTIVDAVGASVCVPENPERIVALMESDLDALLALGITPLGTTKGRGQSTPPRYLAGYTADIVVVGDFYAPNLEQVLELDPDLILMGGFDDETVLAQLNEIAPTINTFVPGEAWQSHFLRVGTILNMEEQAETFIAAYDQRVEEIKAALGDNAGTEFIVSRWSTEGPVIMSPTTFSSLVLQDLELTPPAEIPDLQPGHPHSLPLSLEAVSFLDVDWAFIGTLGEEGDAVVALEEAVETPLFQQLSVVQNNHVVFIDGSLWTSIGGPLAAMQVLEDVAAALTTGG